MNLVMKMMLAFFQFESRFYAFVCQLSCVIQKVVPE